MRGFGKSNGGGRRAALREQTPILVTYFTLSRSDSAELVNVSSTGVRLRAEVPPESGEELVLTMEGIRAYGIVVWSSGNECGVAFDDRLPPGSLQSLRRSVALSGGMTPDLKEAFEQWTLGIAR